MGVSELAELVDRVSRLRGLLLSPVELLEVGELAHLGDVVAEAGQCDEVGVLVLAEVVAEPLPYARLTVEVLG
jgi:hypothetical protein